MESYKRGFIEYLILTNALKISTTRDYKLKSGRLSPWFVNLGDFNDGDALSALGAFYADSLLNANYPVDVLYGIPERGILLAIPTVTALSQKQVNVFASFTRKQEKSYGEVSMVAGDEDIEAKRKKIFVGKTPHSDHRIGLVDDVLTTGGAKYETLSLLKGLQYSHFAFLAIALDRQEVNEEGISATDKFQSDTGIPIVSIINAGDVYQYLQESVPFQKPDGSLMTEEHLESLSSYFQEFGTEALKNQLTG